MALRSTQPLTEMNIWNISCEVKTAGAYYCESNDNCVRMLVTITELSYGRIFSLEQYSLSTATFPSEHGVYRQISLYLRRLD
jgi:hypothetical protein